MPCLCVLTLEMTHDGSLTEMWATVKLEMCVPSQGQGREGRAVDRSHARAVCSAALGPCCSPESYSALESSRSHRLLTPQAAGPTKRQGSASKAAQKPAV